MTALSRFKRIYSILSNSYSGLLNTYKENPDKKSIQKKWGREMLELIGMELEVIGTPAKDESLLFVGNHISYTDIPLLFSIADGVSFVSKEEVAKWPIFGQGAQQLDCLFVKRSSSNSRSAIKLAVQEALSSGRRIVIFPSGTTSIDHKKQWKKGPFEIAMAAGCRIQPFRLHYEPLRDVAYIDKDFFPVHLFKMLRHEKLKARIEFKEPMTVTDPIKDAEALKEWTKGAF